MTDTLQLVEHAAGAAETVVDLICRGQPVAMRSETVYGLFADATSSAAVARVFAAKGRPMFNPLIAHCADPDMADAEAEFDATARKLADAFWPGPLTLVLPRKSSGVVCDLACAGLDTIGLRVPSSPFLKDIITRVRKPLAGPSANIAGRLSPTTARAVTEDLDGRIAAVVDGGDAAVGIESTVIATFEGEVRLLRPGAITADAVAEVVGMRPQTATKGEGGPISPGMLTSHYAPNAPVRLDAREVYPGEALLAFGPELPAGSEDALEVLNLSPRGDLTRAAANLFRNLRTLDRFEPTAIAVAPIPEEGLGAAIVDRLRRASAEREPNGT